ncbi:MAG: hypothetical protein KDD67_12380 [Ignavibacteriae bacterium]|nr:hypothetical protein [Ignavibacteriota bacterium]MCB9217189.1 hypothetical protein [Ignavibacteria bacterium]
MNQPLTAKPAFFIVVTENDKIKVIGAGVAHSRKGSFHLIIHDEQYLAVRKNTKNGKGRSVHLQFPLPLSE